MEKEGYERLVGDLIRPLEGAEDGTGDGADTLGDGNVTEELEGGRAEGQGDARTVGGTEDSGGAEADAAETVDDDVDEVVKGGSTASGGEKAADESGTDFTPLNAEQLTFTTWEEADMKRLWPLFRTPRTVKRFVNIYRLLRAGLQSRDEVARFEGSEEKPGQYQVLMLLLAVVTGYPDQAARFLLAVDGWLDGVEAEGEETGQQWSALMTAVANGEGGDESWRRLVDCLQQVTGEETWRRFRTETMRHWALRVSRYSFALDSSQGVYEEFR